jgi:hypothetical protein
MDSPRRAGGSCGCGAVTFSVHGPLRDVIDCHCERCRKFTGHHMAATDAPSASVIIVDPGGELRWYSPVAGVHYGFCARCGSSLFWRTDDDTSVLSICAGTLDVPTGLRTTRAWWVSQASDYFRRDASLDELERE